MRKVLIDLAKAIPKDASFAYGKRDMEPYRKQVDEVVRKLLLFNKRARKADLGFSKQLSMYERQVNPLFAKKVFKEGVFKKEFVESFGNYRVSPDTVTLIDEIDADYKRRQSNIVLRAVKSIKPEIYERKRRHKVNDNNLKRRFSISHRKVGKLIGNFLSSFGRDSEYLTLDFSDRLQEIEKQMQAEREETEANAANSKYDWGK